jgi:hypothetical protein
MRRHFAQSNRLKAIACVSQVNQLLAGATSPLDSLSNGHLLGGIPNPPLVCLVFQPKRISPLAYTIVPQLHEAANLVSIPERDPGWQLFLS